MEEGCRDCRGADGKKEVTYYLVLKFIFGMTLLSGHDTEQECKQMAAQYMEMLVAQRSDDRKEHGASLLCVGYQAPPMLLTREFSDA